VYDWVKDNRLSQDEVCSKKPTVARQGNILRAGKRDVDIWTAPAARRHAIISWARLPSFLIKQPVLNASLSTRAASHGFGTSFARVTTSMPPIHMDELGRISSNKCWSVDLRKATAKLRVGSFARLLSATIREEFFALATTCSWREPSRYTTLPNWRSLLRKLSPAALSMLPIYLPAVLGLMIAGKRQTS
jgi:hypothetical protein